MGIPARPLRRPDPSLHQDPTGVPRLPGQAEAGQGPQAGSDADTLQVGRGGRQEAGAAAPSEVRHHPNFMPTLPFPLHPISPTLLPPPTHTHNLPYPYPAPSMLQVLLESNPRPWFRQRDRPAVTFCCRGGGRPPSSVGLLEGVPRIRQPEGVLGIRQPEGSGAI